MVEELVKLMSDKDLELQNNLGYTAFALAAMNGFIDMVKPMLQKNKNLATMKNEHNHQIPIVTASIFSQKEMLQLLWDSTPLELLRPSDDDKNGATLVNCFIADEMYGTYLRI